MLGTDIIRMANLMGVTSVHFMTIANWLTSKVGEEWQKSDFKWADIRVTILLADAEKFRQQGTNIICVPDMRFFNEVSGLRNVDGVLIRLYRDTGKQDSIPHPSELEMDRMSDDLFDYVLYEEKNRSLQQLQVFTLHVLMQESLIGLGGMAV